MSVAVSQHWSPRAQRFVEELGRRIVVLDGAMGTMIQSYGLGEAEYRGARFADWSCDLKGNNDLLTLTQPDIIRAIHEAYLDAGADILETNTFNSRNLSDLMKNLLHQLEIAQIFSIGGRVLTNQEEL